MNIPSLWWLTVFKDFFFGFRVELNILLIEARRKAHSKPINILSGLVRAEKRLGNLWTIDLAATDWTVSVIMTVQFSPCSEGVFSSVGENINTTLFIIISIVLG